MMVSDKARCRITLALDITGRIREGPLAGYHDVEVIKHSVDLHDIVTVEESSRTQIECSDPAVPCDRTNLCWRAADLVREKFKISTGARMTITKNIPVRGGLAGGSSNAAVTIMLLDRLWGLAMTRPEMMALGMTLGMDIPYYFAGGTARDRETTGQPEPIDTPLHFAFVLAVPDFGVSTSEAYAALDYGETALQRSRTVAMRKALAAGDRMTLYESLHNDFEPSGFRRYPAMHDLKRELLDAGCLGAVLCGSGSTVAGIVETRRHAEWIAKRLSCRTLVCESAGKG